MTIVRLVFIISTALLIYIYLGYPALMHVLSSLWPKPVNKGFFRPDVSVILTVHNEEALISQKLDNLLALDYPREKLEIIVVDDLSSDRTAEIVRSHPAVKMIKLEKRSGKTAAQNAGAESSRGEALFFTDVTAKHSPEMLTLMVESLSDPEVACVSGSFQYGTDGGGSLSLYAEYEEAIRHWEGRFRSALWLAGCAYVIRKKDYISLPEDMVSDFAEPLLLAAKGKRVILDPKVKTVIDRQVSEASELKRRSRIAAQGLWCLWKQRHLLNPLKYPYISAVLFSRRLLRWLSGLIVAVVLATSAFGWNERMLGMALAIQVIFYAAALLGWLAPKFGFNARLLKPATLLVIQVLAGMIGMFNLAIGQRYIIWNTDRSDQ
jgi:glycosyltransferase involved in cell wall biosynthesis